MATSTETTAAAAADMAANMKAYVQQASQIQNDGQLLLLIAIAFIMGLGKGGVPGFATIATAATVATAPQHIPNGLSLAVALQVPILCMIDVAAAYLHRSQLDWPTVWLLLPLSMIGMLFGQVVDGMLTDASARILVAIILLLILFLRIWEPMAEFLFPVIMERRQRRLEKLREQASSSSTSTHHHDIEGGATTLNTSSSFSSSSSSSSPTTTTTNSREFMTNFIWACIVGLFGGAATMLTNSMGPILNVYLLSIRKLSPSSYIGTRAMFFCFINVFGKLPLRIFYSHTLGSCMIPLACGLGCISIIGVYCAKPIMLSMSENNFVKLELSFVAFTGLRLLYMGLFDNNTE